MTQVLAIINIVQSLVPTLLALIHDAVSAAHTNDQGALDAILARAEAAADALKPPTA